MTLSEISELDKSTVFARMCVITFDLVAVGASSAKYDGSNVEVLIDIVFLSR